MTLEERFWSKVDKTSSPTGCWLWTACVNERGYGMFNVKNRAKRAHRLAYRMVKGPFQDDLDLCHHCDVPRCVNPEHLFLGTAQDNAQDAKSKSRLSPPPLLSGEIHPLHKLEAKDVQRIRATIGQTKALATEFGVSTQLIRNIRRRKTWKHIS